MTMPEERETFNPDSLLGCDSEGGAQNTEKSVGYQELNLLSKLLLSADNESKKTTEKANMVLLDLFPNEDADYSSQLVYLKIKLNPLKDELTILAHSTFCSSASEARPQLRAPTSPALVVDARNQEKAQELEDLFKEMSVISTNRPKNTGSSEDLLDLIPNSR